MNENVYIRQTENAGRGLYASKPFSKGETVLLETPLNAMQSLDNLQNVMVCANCFGFVGSLDSQIAILRGLPRVEVLDINAHAAAENIIAAIIPCTQDCGEVYCSEVCRDTHFQRCHRLLCTGPIPDEIAHEHPLIKFKMHALQTNEIFLLVAAVLCTIVTRYEETGGADLDYARQPYRDFVQHCWWDVVGGGELGETLNFLVRESCALLKETVMMNVGFEGLDEILNPEYFSRIIGMFEQNNVGIRSESPVGDMLAGSCSAAELEYLRPILEEAVFGSSCESEEEEESFWSSACNADDEQKDDIDLSFSACNAGDEQKDEIHLSEQIHSENALYDDQIEANATGEEIPKLIDELRSLSVLDGTALYTLICAMNHSCDPNCQIKYRSAKNQPLQAEVIALKNIEANEELRQSYIDKDEILENRQKAIQDYGFVCNCNKCQADLKISFIRTHVII